MSILKLSVSAVFLLFLLIPSHSHAFFSSGDCATNNGGCGSAATCSDLGGGSLLCSCNLGYSDTGMACEDIDECAFSNDCDEHATCTNISGSYNCTCDAGYTGNGLTCSVSAVDECTLGTDTCDENATCTDTADSFTCACNDGYTEDGETCTNIDECTLGTDTCSTSQTCTDTPGSYTCTCASGTRDHEGQCYPDLCLPGSGGCTSRQTCTFVSDAFVCVFATGVGGGTTTTTPAHSQCSLLIKEDHAAASDERHTMRWSYAIAVSSIALLLTLRWTKEW